eukprot:SAG31_NODE_4220_length_3449_cov_1.831940_1_plen_451_part_10
MRAGATGASAMPGWRQLPPRLAVQRRVTWARGCGLIAPPALARCASSSSAVRLPTDEERPQLVRLRHTLSHVLAQAVQTKWPGAQVTLGPWTADGFYYDFALQTPFTEADLEAIKAEMDRIIGRDLELRREDVPAAEARRRLQRRNEPYKLEILNRIAARETYAAEDAVVSLYHTGDEWWDLCAGPHVGSTAEISPAAYRLTGVSAVHWRPGLEGGDEEGAAPSLQRVRGVAWESPEQLAAWDAQQAEAARRDHRVLGSQLDLFTVGHPLVGPGLVLWHPRGARLRETIMDYWKSEHHSAGYEMLSTPHMGKAQLWNTSGHSNFYDDSMFSPVSVPRSGTSHTDTHRDSSSGADACSEMSQSPAVDSYRLKPMNCPFHCAVYASRVRPARELPLRWAELGTVYRYEPSGTLHGLLRVRGFTQDDSHIFCTPAQAAEEIAAILKLTERFLRT